MSVNELKSICRGCLATERRMVNASLYEAEYKILTDITILQSDGLPQWLCYECIALLDKCVRFRNKIMESDYMLRQHVDESVPLEYNKGAISHLSRSNIHHSDIPGTQTEQPGEAEDPGAKDFHFIDVTHDIDNVKVEIKKERSYSPYDEYITIDEMSVEQQLKMRSQSTDRTCNADSVEHSRQEELMASLQLVRAGARGVVQRAREHLRDHSNAHVSKQPELDAKSKDDPKVNKESLSYINSNIKHNIIGSGRKFSKSYICDECGKCFGRKKPLISHISKHFNTNTYKCDVCAKCFLTKSKFTRHYRIHSEDKPFKCDVCQKCFKFQCLLTAHYRHHTGDEPYKCDVCMKSFKYKFYLKAHYRLHTGEEPFKCDICKKTFKRKSYLTAHYRTHTGEEPYKCDVCMKGFKRKGNLTAHYRTHTGQQPYNCDVCMKTFTNKNALTVHYRLHTGDKPYKCDLCPKSFVSKGMLNLHNRKHTADKPYKCDVCMKCFGYRNVLKQHLLTHTGERPYECDICLKAFSQKNNLLIHYHSHSDDIQR